MATSLSFTCICTARILAIEHIELEFCEEGVLHKARVEGVIPHHGLVVPRT
jgi:hypothetical protein